MNWCSEVCAGLQLSTTDFSGFREESPWSILGVKTEAVKGNSHKKAQKTQAVESL